MKPWVAALVTLWLLAACASTGIPVAPSCQAGAAYSGPPLRAALPARLLPIREARRLGAAERQEIAAAVETAFARSGAATMTAAVWTGAGAPLLVEKATPAGALHYWASVGKLVTAAAVLRLAQEGRLGLDDPVAHYVEGVPDGGMVTLRMLLEHTSGLFSANEDPGFRAAGGPLDVEAVLEVARRRGSYACPGTRWRYSNSGYALLGAVIEKVSGKPYPEAARELVLSRSSARRIRMLAPGDALADVVPLAPAADAGGFSPREPQAAGGVVADAAGMAQFLADLLEGRIVSEDALRGMFARLYPMMQAGLWYGTGTMVYDVPGPAGADLWIGHSGGVPGGKAVVAYVPSRHAIIAVALTGEGSAEASANLIAGALSR